VQASYRYTRRHPQPHHSAAAMRLTCHTRRSDSPQKPSPMPVSRPAPATLGPHPLSFSPESWLIEMVCSWASHFMCPKCHRPHISCDSSLIRLTSSLLYLFIVSSSSLYLHLSLPFPLSCFSFVNSPSTVPCPFLADIDYHYVSLRRSLFPLPLERVRAESDELTDGC